MKFASCLHFDARSWFKLLRIIFDIIRSSSPLTPRWHNCNLQSRSEFLIYFYCIIQVNLVLISNNKSGMISKSKVIWVIEKILYPNYNYEYRRTKTYQLKVNMILCHFVYIKTKHKKIAHCSILEWMLLSDEEDHVTFLGNPRTYLDMIAYLR